MVGEFRMVTENKEPPAIPWLIKRWKERKIRKKKQEIQELELEIQKAKLEKELKEAKEQ